ncbi:MAG: hypothetical protein JRH19_15285 [Deltaproteobacteria bacterium]|nr:hypothetical protein [Deltaproteobacteria bacterium]
MTPISGRYLVPLVALLVLALIPVATRHVGGNRGDACASPAALYEVSDIPKSQFQRPHPDAGVNVPSWIQWTQGRMRPSSVPGVTLRFDLIRAYSALDLHIWAHNTLTPDFYVEPADLVPVDAGGDTLPVLIRRNRGVGFGAMLFIDAGRPTANPVAASLQRALRHPLGPLLPSTIFFIRTPALLGMDEATEDEALRWIRNAWLFYQANCAS